MAKQATPPATSESAPAHLAVMPLLELRLERSGFHLQYVEKRKAIEDADTHADEAILERLLNDGFDDPQAEFQALFAQFGLTAYASKADLYKDGTKFRISNVVRRIGGGYSGDDDWGLSIVTENGEPQMLTFESNPGRDRFLIMMAYYVWKRGVTDFCKLDAYENKNDQVFYAISVAGNGPTMKTVRQLADESVTSDFIAETIEQA